MAGKANYLQVSVFGQSFNLVSSGLQVAQFVDADGLGYVDFTIDGTGLGWDYDGGTTDRVELIGANDVITLTRVGDRWRWTIQPDDLYGNSTSPGSTFSVTCHIAVTRTTAGDTATNAPSRWASQGFTVTVERVIGFSPDSISGLIGWYSAYDLTTAVAGQVSSWEDRSRYGFDLAQGTSGQQPKRYNNGDGRPYLLFDGTDDNMLTAAGALGGDLFGTASTAIVVAQIDSYDATTRGIVQVGGTNGGRIAFNSSNLKGLSGSDVANTSLPTLDAPFVATMTTTASGAITIKKGTASAVTTSSTNAVTAGVIQIGDTAADSPAAFRIHELIVWDNVLSAENQARVIRALQKIWNATG